MEFGQVIGQKFSENTNQNLAKKLAHVGSFWVTWYLKIVFLNFLTLDPPLNFHWGILLKQRNKHLSYCISVVSAHANVSQSN